jgi:hypothetical protein
MARDELLDGLPPTILLLERMVMAQFIVSNRRNLQHSIVRAVP